MKEVLHRCLKEGLRPTVREEVQRRISVLNGELGHLTRLEIIDRVADGMDEAFERVRETAAPGFSDTRRVKVVREVIGEVLQEFRARAVH